MVIKYPIKYAFGKIQARVTQLSLEFRKESVAVTFTRGKRERLRRGMDKTTAFASTPKKRRSYAKLRHIVGAAI